MVDAVIGQRVLRRVVVLRHVNRKLEIGDVAMQPGVLDAHVERLLRHRHAGQLLAQLAILGGRARVAGDRDVTRDDPSSHGSSCTSWQLLPWLPDPATPARHGYRRTTPGRSRWDARRGQHRTRSGGPGIRTAGTAGAARDPD